MKQIFKGMRLLESIPLLLFSHFSTFPHWYFGFYLIFFENAVKIRIISKMIKSKSTKINYLFIRLFKNKKNRHRINNLTPCIKNIFNIYFFKISIFDHRFLKREAFWKSLFWSKKMIIWKSGLWTVNPENLSHSMS